MAEALLKKREPTPSSYDNQSAQQNTTILQSNYGSIGSSGSMSIAMRMKRNRDAQLGINATSSINPNTSVTIEPSTLSEGNGNNS